jgi:hypothetical protein
MRDIATADHVTLVNDFGNAITTTNRETIAKIIQAIRSAKRDNHPYKAMYRARLRFHLGTNLLKEVRFQDRVFLIQGQQYNDATDLLGKAYRNSAAESERTFE